MKIRGVFATDGAGRIRSLSNSCAQMGHTDQPSVLGLLNAHAAAGYRTFKFRNTCGRETEAPRADHRELIGRGGPIPPPVIRKEGGRQESAITILTPPPIRMRQLQDPTSGSTFCSCFVPGKPRIPLLISTGHGPPHFRWTRTLATVGKHVLQLYTPRHS